MPACDGQITAKDSRARKSLINLIQQKQDGHFRKHYKVVVPEKPTGLPDDYDILIYYGYTSREGIHIRRMEVNVRGNRATGEMVTAAGIRRGPLDVGYIDELARQLTYARQAEVTEIARTDESDDSSGPFYHRGSLQPMELISRDPKKPFHLMAELWFPREETIRHRAGGVVSFTEGRLSSGVESVLREKLELLPRTDELGREVVSRLGRIKTPEKTARAKVEKPKNEKQLSSLQPHPDKALPHDRRPLDSVYRHDLASIEAKLYSHLAIDWRLEEALPELRRLGLGNAAIRLSIATSDDPTELLKTGLMHEDWGLFRWSLAFTVFLSPQKRAEVFVDSLPGVKDEFRASDVLKYLSLSPLSMAQEVKVEEFFEQSEGVRSKIAAAGLLLEKTDEDKYYEFLTKAAGKWEKTDVLDVYDPARGAIEALVSYSSIDGKKRKETAALIRTLLGRISMDAHADFSGMRLLVANLPSVGEEKDVELLTKYCKHSDASMVMTALGAIEEISPKTALKKARRQIDKYLDDEYRTSDGRVSFDWYVLPYFDLIFWQNDKSAIEPLKRSLEIYRKRQPDRTDWIEETQVLLNYLQAERVEQRVKYALQYATLRYVDDEKLKQVGERLVAEGADEKLCKPLLRPEPDRLYDEFSRSSEAVPW